MYVISAGGTTTPAHNGSDQRQYTESYKVVERCCLAIILRGNKNSQINLWQIPGEIGKALHAY